MSCPACFSGFLMAGTPAGTVETVCDTPTYVTRPPDGVEPRAAVVYVPDAFGWELVNNRLVADSIARKGRFVVYLPEFMAGHPAAMSLLPNSLENIRAKPTSIGDLFKKLWKIIQVLAALSPFLFYNRPGRSYPRVKAFTDSLSSTSPLPLFAAGYCWGGKHVFTLAADPDSPVRAVFAGHPSLLSFPADVSRVRKPLSVAVGEHDDALTQEKVRRMRELLDGREGGGESEVVVYEGARHGFCTRLDRTNPEQARQAEEAEDQVVRWFERFL